MVDLSGLSKTRLEVYQRQGLGVGGGLSDSKLVDGLKEALQIGTGNAVQTISKIAGYYNNPKIKIPLPKSVQKVEKLVGPAGYGSQMDAFELSMNQAAEKAAPEKVRQDPAARVSDLLKEVLGKK